MRFDNRVALITGAGRGIGQATALKLASEGAAVVCADMDVGPAQETVDLVVGAGGRATPIACDVTDRAQVEAAVQRAVSEHGRLDILVACAGIIRDNLLFKMSVADWDSVMNVHLRGSFLMARAVQGYMTKAGWGRIVNLSSTSALGNRGQANYAAAKAGVQGFTKTLALELGRFGVTVNAIAPGFIETEMTMATAERMGVPFEEFKAVVVKEIPVGRSGLPADIAHTVSFFTSEGAGFVSGQVIYVAGGPKA
jgi:3-oxoacyl-[acyl-carrier protein] reductase